MRERGQRDREEVETPTTVSTSERMVVGGGAMAKGEVSENEEREPRVERERKRCCGNELRSRRALSAPATRSLAEEASAKPPERRQHCSSGVNGDCD